MVESEAQELSEDVMLGAVTFGHSAFQPVIQAIIELAEHAAKEPWAAARAVRGRNGAGRARRRAGPRADRRRLSGDATSRRATTRSAPPRRPPPRRWPPKALDADKAKGLFKDLEADIVRNAILDTGLRIDGRDTRPCARSSPRSACCRARTARALFTRGETQALCVATLGTGQDEQIIDALEGEYREHFMLHYNFPPYSVGEAGRMGSPGRREIGHGKLAWRAIHPLLPAKDKFPYTLRVVSEITESNGSSSMATVCGTSLALMDAGVPLKRPVAGIAMGLIKEDRGFAVLSDILGDEDHLGDMDFKVAGTEQGVTALQMDIKITSITPEIMQIALEQAHDGRMHILGEMAKALTGARDDVGGNRAAHHHHQRAEGQDPRSDRHRRQGDPRDRRADRLQDRHRRRRHDQDRRDRAGAGAGGDRLDPRHRGRAGDRRDLQRQGGEDRRFRRLRELPRLQGRARAYQRAGARAASARPPTWSMSAMR